MTSRTASASSSSALIRRWQPASTTDVRSSGTSMRSEAERQVRVCLPAAGDQHTRNVVANVVPSTSMRASCVEALEIAHLALAEDERSRPAAGTRGSRRAPDRSSGCAGWRCGDRAPPVRSAARARGSPDLSPSRAGPQPSTRAPPSRRPPYASGSINPRLPSAAAKQDRDGVGG